MASNFFQRWSDRSLATKDHTPSDLPQSQDTAVEPTALALNTDSNTKPSAENSAEDIVDNCIDNSAENNSESGIENSAQATAALHQSCPSPVVTAEAADNSEEALTIDDADNVTFDSGVASFLQHGVDKSVKKAALAKLFHSDEFNYISDMDDHTEDFSNIPKLDENVAKQLRGWVKAVLEEPEQDTELIAEDEALEESDAKLIAAPEMLAADDDTVALVTEDNTSIPCCDEQKNKLEQTGET